MKHLKKISVLLLSLLMGMMVLTGCSGELTSAEKEAIAREEIHEANLESLKSITENSFASLLTTYTADVVEFYLSQGSSIANPTFDNSFLNRWKAFEADHGAIIDAEVIEASEKEGEYSARIKITGEDDEPMVLTINYNGQMTPVSTGLDDYQDDSSLTLGQKMANAGGNIVVGLLIVFFMLVLLCLIISSFTLVNKASAPKKKTVEKKEAAPAPKAAPVAAPAPAAVDNSQLIAVIAAAIAAAEGTSTDGFVVRSIKRLDSNKWR
ncbi:MAG: OadG family protein [Lachnospiraceae bacterium]|nr:OadG family protein [Candidatus Equihabitans merdae]